jgi:hypothetical protein
MGGSSTSCNFVDLLFDITYCMLCMCLRLLFVGLCSLFRQSQLPYEDGIR